MKKDCRNKVIVFFCVKKMNIWGVIEKVYVSDWGGGWVNREGGRKKGGEVGVRGS